MKSNKVLLSAAVTVLAAAFLYCSGLLAQLFYNRETWLQSGGGGMPELPSLAPMAIVRALLRWPYGPAAILTLLVLLAGLWFYFFRMGRDGASAFDEARNLEYSDKGTYGTAGFMTEEELTQVLERKSAADTRGVILGAMGGDALSLPPDTRMNSNIMVYGASGSMKSRAFVRNRIFQATVRGESLILTDPKSELYCDTAQYLRDQGYEVMVFNLVDPLHSDAWNCLAEAHGDDMMFQTMAQVIIQNSNDGKSDHFWDGAEENLLKALLLYVDRSFSEDQRNLASAYDVLAGTAQSIQSIAEHLPRGHPAKPCFNLFLQASDTVKSGAVMGLADRLQVLQNRPIRAITSCSEIDLTAPGQRKCAYFCITSDQDSTFEFLSSLFFSFLFIKLVRYADTSCPGRRLPVPVHILGDELMNCGKIPNLGRRLAVVRSRNISVSVIIQNLGQLQNRYPNNEWIEVIGNCDTSLFLGCTDDLTAKFISERAGDVTIGYTTEARVYDSMQLSRWTPQYRETQSLGKRKLLTMDEVLRMPLDRELIILRGQKVLEADKFDYLRHPHARLLKPISASEHIPRWAAAEKEKPATPEVQPEPKPKPQARPKQGTRSRPTPPAKPRDKAQEEPLTLTDPHHLF